MLINVLYYCYTFYLFLLVVLYQKGGKETILEEELEFKGIEEEEEEEGLADTERNSVEGDKDKGKERLLYSMILMCFFLLNYSDISQNLKKIIRSLDLKSKF